MDSNNSPNFERGYGTRLVLSKVIDDMEFQNLIRPQYNECFKMRHCQGGQPTKFGQLMFDCLEKVLISKHGKGHQLHCDKQVVFNFQHYSHDEFELLNAIREDPLKRAALLQHAANIDNIAEAGDFTPSSVMNPKGQVLFTMDQTAANRWGPCVPGPEKLKKLAGELGVSEQKLYHILTQLYPNEASPSDHPPVAVEVEF